METESLSPVEVPPSRIISDIVYCNICSLPSEYCEFGPSEADCMEWLKSNHSALHQKLKGDLSVENLKISGKSAKKKDVAKVIIKRSERNKRKCVTCILGLEHYSVDLKKAAKLFANKFATGSSVSKNNQGLDEIVVQGDLQSEIFDLIRETWKNIDKSVIDLTEGKR